MTLGIVQSGYNNSTEYQASGIPWLYSITIVSPSKINLVFPFVTKNIVVMNSATSTNIASIGFTEKGIDNDRKIILKGGSSISLDVRMTNLYISGTTGTSSISVCAALTGIPVARAPDISKFPGYDSTTPGEGGV